ncbi:MAG TPA: hypothetical protein VFC46_17490 [Humisphaera sp.]|nr:hypothetical protein [Humisphaera sp.]
MIFLGACLAFAEALAGMAGHLDAKLSGLWVLFFGTVNLALVLLSLLYMFWRKPEFLIAERGDLVGLRVIEAIIAQDNPKLVQELIKNFKWETAARPSSRPKVDPTESIPNEAETKNLKEERARLEQKITGGK